ncbi:MAG: DUF4286 family protein [Gammaproteobacteria bacterium]|nr:DUF4286 family protein [Gammaproteobacteria bacterium]MDH3430156.1 DUF4286 family protein [Gammaproteobacteria bacterium]MDH3432845.1 DUF4286 family protein [Gammaproteobacteria bacterium]
MTSESGPIYEVTFFVDPEVAGDCDAWLEEHVRSMLREPGIVDCSVFALPNDPQGRVRRVCLHVLASDEALDQFLEGAGTDIEAELQLQLGEQISVSGRLLREDHAPFLAPESSPDCLNCGARLRGQYCGTCGQRSRSRLISLWELISDAFGDLFELDSRLWQTLIPLMFRPGRLTHDYLQGRRARYMPPFRMYLVLSLFFFVVAFFDPREELSLLFESDPPTSHDEVGSVAGEQAQEILNDIIEHGGEDALPAQVDDHEEGLRLVFEDNEIGSADECNVDESDVADMPAWLARRLSPERLNHICERIFDDDGRALADNLLDNVPAALIILLPLMAFVLKALYPLSKRYYVEHLLFFVHFHAFFFLILTLQILFLRITALLHVPEAIRALAVVVAAFYVPVYLFVAMRRVYGQGRLITFLKYVVLVIAYAMGFTATMLGALAIAAFSI